MSPVSPVFNTVVTVSIGLKNVPRVSIHSVILYVYGPIDLCLLTKFLIDINLCP